MTACREVRALPRIPYHPCGASSVPRGQIPGCRGSPRRRAACCTGDVFHPNFEITDSDTHLSALAPCQSLGAFYVAPTPAAQRFLAALAHWVMYTCAACRSYRTVSSAMYSCFRTLSMTLVLML